MMKPKLMFLDIDSVLNTADTMRRVVAGDDTIIVWKSNGLVEIADPVYIARIHDIVQRTDCIVIGISSWFSSRRDRAEISKVLDIPFVDVIDHTGGGMSRVRSVQRYLDSHDWESFVVIDDIPDFSPTLQANHVQPIGSGLTEELADLAVRILGIADR